MAGTLCRLQTACQQVLPLADNRLSLVTIVVGSVWVRETGTPVGCDDSNVCRTGVVVGTLGVAGFLQAAEEVRRLARAAGKRTYTLLMGKPNPAKLANFPEVEVFVMIADAQVILSCTTPMTRHLQTWDLQLFISWPPALLS